MRKHLIRVGLIGTAATLAAVSSASVFALPVKGPIHSPTPVTTVTPPVNDLTTTNGSSGTPSSQPTTTGQANAQQPVATAQQQACQDRQAAINNIITRIDTRTQSQITLFDTIATRVETFYASKGKTVSNYNQLVTTVTEAMTQAKTDLSSMQSNSTLDCTGSNPKGTVTAFQNYLKAETTDLQDYRTAVKSLTAAVASANGVTVSDSSQSGATSSPGGQ